MSVCTCSVDSGGIVGTRPLRCRNVALDVGTAKAPTIGLSKLNSMAFGLTVYASQAGLPRRHARLASGRWSDATGRAFHPQDSIQRFQSCFLHLILLCQASWRNPTHQRALEAAGKLSGPLVFGPINDSQRLGISSSQALTKTFRVIANGVGERRSPAEMRARNGRPAVLGSFPAPEKRQTSAAAQDDQQGRLGRRCVMAAPS